MVSALRICTAPLQKALFSKCVVWMHLYTHRSTLERSIDLQSGEPAGRCCKKWLTHLQHYSRSRKKSRAGRRRVAQIEVAESQKREKGVAELRSSVVRFNGKIASPTRRRRKRESEKRNEKLLDGGVYNSHARVRIATGGAKAYLIKLNPNKPTQWSSDMV